MSPNYIDAEIPIAEQFHTHIIKLRWKLLCPHILTLSDYASADILYW